MKYHNYETGSYETYQSTQARELRIVLHGPVQLRSREHVLQGHSSIEDEYR